jgi:hypothetical protein
MEGLSSFEGDTQVVDRKNYKRKRPAQLNVRQEPDVRHAFKEEMERLGPAVQKAGGGNLTQSALVEYWCVWFARLGGASRSLGTG